MPSQIRKRLQLRQKSIQVDDKMKYADLFDFVDKKYSSQVQVADGATSSTDHNK